MQQSTPDSEDPEPFSPDKEEPAASIVDDEPGDVPEPLPVLPDIASSE